MYFLWEKKITNMTDNTSMEGDPTLNSGEQKGVFNAEQLSELLKNFNKVLDTVKDGDYLLDFDSMTYEEMVNFLFFGGKGTNGILHGDMASCCQTVLSSVSHTRPTDLAMLLTLLPILFLDFGNLLAHNPNSTAYGSHCSQSVLKKIDFLVDSEQSSYDDWPLSDLVEKRVRNIQNGNVVLSRLVHIHLQFYEEVRLKSSEALNINYVGHYLRNVTRILRQIEGSHYGLEKTLGRSRVDGMFLFEKEGREINFAPIVIKKPLFHNLLGPDTERFTKQMTEKQWLPLMQGTYYLLKGNFPGFMVADGYHYVFCEIDWRKFKRLQNEYETSKNTGEVPILPFKFKYRNLSSINPSLTLCLSEQLMEWYLVVRDETQEEKLERQSVFQEILPYIHKPKGQRYAPPSATPASSYSSIISSRRTATLEYRPHEMTLALEWSDIVDVFHFPWSVIVQVRAGVLMEGIYLEDRKNLKDDDLVMLKLPWVSLESSLDMFAKRKLRNKDADRENENIHALFGIKGFNNCFLRHNYEEVEIHDKDRVFKCHFVASRYIQSILPEDDDYDDEENEETERMKIDLQEEELRRKIYQQEQLLVNSGIYHNELAMRNIRYDGQDVYLIDFADAGSVPVRW